MKKKRCSFLLWPGHLTAGRAPVSGEPEMQKPIGLMLGVVCTKVALFAGSSCVSCHKGTDSSPSTRESVKRGQHSDIDRFV